MRGETSLAKNEQRAWLDQQMPQLRAELEALDAKKLIPLNIDVPSAICTVYGVLPKLQLLRPRLATLVDFDLAAFDRLELYADALQKAHGNYLATVEPRDHLNELVQRALALRTQLLASARALAVAGLLDPATLRNIKTQAGFKPLAMDLLGLAQIFSRHAPAFAGKSPITDLDLAQAQSLSVTLLTVIGRRQFTQALAVAAQLRLRTFTLFILTYDDTRRAITYLCGRHTDPNTIAPSLYGGRKRRKGETTSASSRSQRASDSY